MKKILFFSILALFSLSLKAQPTIAAFNPSSGSPGTTVILTGTNFNTSAPANIVYFGAVRATVTAASATSLTVTVPFGATYERISVTDNSSHLTGYSDAPFAPSFSCDASFTPLSFDSLISFPTHSWPRDAALADLDADGRTDIVTVSYSAAYSFGLLKNTSMGNGVSYASPVYFGSNYDKAFLEDMNGDGKKDLIAGGYSSSSIYLNNSSPGSITFSSPYSFPAPFGFEVTAVGDLDNDGRPDVAGIVSGQPNLIFTVTNSSSGGTILFSGAIGSFNSGNGPIEVYISDLDGDSSDDVIVLNSDSTISLLRNASSSFGINFDPKIDIFTNSSPKSITAADLDGDGKKEIITTSYYSNLISIFPNLSIPGTFTFGTELTMTGNNPMGVKAADLNGDGKPELVVADNNVTVYENTNSPGMISFSSGQSYPGSIGIPYNVEIADLNMDGRPEIIQANTDDFTLGGQTVTILLNEECLTGIDENQTQVNHNIYPNPFSTESLLSFDREIKNGLLVITDVMGRKVAKENFSGKEYILKRNTMVDGIYFLQVFIDDRSVISDKFIIH